MTETAEAEGFLMLLNHFDPTTELEDRLYSRNLVYGLEMGRRNFAHYTETVRCRFMHIFNSFRISHLRLQKKERKNKDISLKVQRALERK